jgi:hypothetical protein
VRIHAHQDLSMRSICRLASPCLCFAIVCSSCAKPGRTAGRAPVVPERRDSEFQKGPPPALPNPMLVTDSVHGGVFESCYQGFRPSGNVERDRSR